MAQVRSGLNHLCRGTPGAKAIQGSQSCPPATCKKEKNGDQTGGGGGAGAAQPPQNHSKKCKVTCELKGEILRVVVVLRERVT